MNKIALIFGASGSIGQSICNTFIDKGYEVLAVSRVERQLSHVQDHIHWFCWQNFLELSDLKLQNILNKQIDCVVWAQGMNFNDSIIQFDQDLHLKMYEANVGFILNTLNHLINQQLLKKSAKLCVISSIWQNIARQNKLSYCVTKSALQGLVQSVSIDLGREGYLMNAVLPGALDTPMTRNNLSKEQIQSLEMATPLHSLPQLRDVSELVYFLCSELNTGITGQFICADKGFSHARIL